MCSDVIINISGKNLLYMMEAKSFLEVWIFWLWEELYLSFLRPEDTGHYECRQSPEASTCTW